MNTQDVGKFISELRKSHSMTQKDLAEKLNVTDKAVSKWETGKCYPDIETIERLSEIFDVSINDILSGRIAEPHEISENADKNIVEVMKTSKKSKSRWRFAVLILGIALLLVGIFAVYKTVTAPKTEHLKITLNSQEAYDVFSSLNTAVYGELGCTEETVVTDLRVNFDENDNLTDLTLSLWDLHTLKSVEVCYMYFQESNSRELLVSSVQMSKNLNFDGIPLETVSKLLSTQKLSYCMQTQSNIPRAYTVDFDNTMYKTIGENENVGIAGFGYSYLYKDGEIKHFTNLSQVEGKVFEVAIFVPEEYTEENTSVASSCLIHIPR